MHVTSHYYRMQMQHAFMASSAAADAGRTALDSAHPGDHAPNIRPLRPSGRTLRQLATIYKQNHSKQG